VDTVAIVGAGLIGGSFGLALRKAGFSGRILGVSSDAALREALAAGAIDEGLPLEQAVPQADLVYLSQTISRILETIPRLDALLRPGALVTDAGSTKLAIMECAGRHITRARFLGGHPMAGSEHRGASAGSPLLFQDRTYVLTPASPEELDTPAAREFRKWIWKIGAAEMLLTPDQHDRIVALTSHLPQLASTALAATVAARLESEDHLRASGLGLADTTRLALSSFDVWQDILATNRQAVGDALDAYIRALEGVRERLPGPNLVEDFRRGAELRRKLAGRQP
jgi:prephenate dehydrogenase